MQAHGYSDSSASSIVDKLNDDDKFPSVIVDLIRAMATTTTATKMTATTVIKMVAVAQS